MKKKGIMQFMKSNKYILLMIFFVIVSILLIFIWLFNNSDSNDYVDLKSDTQYDYVYVKDKLYDDLNRVYVDVPYLNINSEDAQKVNENIVETYKTIMTNIGYSCKYDTYISSNILSIVISAKYSEPDNTLFETYKYFTYNYDLKNNKYLSDDELLKKFDVKEEDVNRFLDNKFFNFYYLLAEKDIIDHSEYSYVEFLENKEITNLLDEVSYSVEKDSLVVYRPFAITAAYDDDKYFSEKDFKFIVVDNSK